MKEKSKTLYFHYSKNRTDTLPSVEELNNLKPGNIVRVCGGSKKSETVGFCTVVKEIKGDVVLATGNDMPIIPDWKSYIEHEDVNEFSKECIYKIYPEMAHPENLKRLGIETI